MRGRDLLDFMDRLNDGGLLFLNHYLEDACGCRVFHISPSSRIIYDGEEQLDELVKDIQKSNLLKTHLYNPEKKYFIYRFHVNEYMNQFVFFPIKEEETERILQAIEDITLPLSCFLRGLYLSHTQVKRYSSYLPEKIFYRDNTYWRELLAEKRFDENAASFAVVTVPKSPVKSSILREGAKFLSNIAIRSGNMNIMTYAFRDALIQIFPTYQNIHTQSDQIRKEDEYPLLYQKGEFEHQFRIKVRVGVGMPIKLRDLYISYIQARTAVYFLEYFNKTEELLCYEDIGHLRWYLKQDLKQLTKNLKKEFTDIIKERMMNTLRMVVKQNYHYQNAADALFIHLNTLYYRMDKIQNILKKDFSEMSVKIHYYNNVFTYDLLEYIGENNFPEF